MFIFEPDTFSVQTHDELVGVRICLPTSLVDVY